MRKKNKKKQNPILYQKYKRCKETTTDKNLIPTDNSLEIIQQEDKKPSINQRPGHNLIIIGSLSNGCGCSHMAFAVAVYLQMQRKKVCMIHNNNAEYESMNIMVFPFARLDEIYNSYEFIVFDFGCVQTNNIDRKRELYRADLKILMCRMEESYLKELAHFIQDQKDETWNYVFNYVPKKQYKEVDDLMEGYPVSILPLFQVSDMDREMKKLLNSILF